MAWNRPLSIGWRRRRQCAATHARRLKMKSSSLLRTAIFAATIAILGVSAQAGPMPTQSAATLKSMISQNTIEVRGVGWRTGAYGYRCGFRGDSWGCSAFRNPTMAYDDGIRNSYACSGSFCSRPLAATTYNDRLPWID